jgi:hypothetical protein
LGWLTGVSPAFRSDRPKPLDLSRSRVCTL